MTTTTINKGTPFERVEHRNADSKLHRDDGPAVEWASGYKEWYRDGNLHRADGPAIEWASGDKEWYRDGKPLTEAEFQKAAKSDGGPGADHAINRHEEGAKP